MSAIKRLVLVSAALLVAFAAAEVSLRAAYSTLPSLAGLAGATTWKEADSVQNCDARALRLVEPAEREVVGRSLLTVGDSVTLGFGVQRNARFGALLARKLSMLGSRWAEVNRSFAGGTACITLSLATTALAESHADLAVVGLFADDLMEAPRFSVNGHRVAFPDTIHRPAERWLVEHSYALNTIWWGTETALFNRPHSLSHDGPTVAQFKRSLAELRAQGEAVGTPIVLALLPPAGLPLCAKGGTEAEVCALDVELDRLAQLLDEAWPGWVDLRTVFDDGDYRLDVEKADRRIDIHPNEAGHVRIANALFPAVSAAVTP